MKVLMIGWEYPPKIDGGLGAHFYNLTSSLAKQDVGITAVLPSFCRARATKNIHFVFAHFSKKGRSYTGFLESVKRYNKSICRITPALVREKKIGLIHAHDWITFESAVWLKEKTGKKLLITFHSTEYDRNEYADAKDPICRMEKTAAKKADGIIAVSSMVRDALVKKYGADRKKISVVPNGPSLSGFPKAKEKNTVLFAGRLASQKGAEYLLGAIPLIKHECRFLFCGEGHLRKPLEAYAEAIGVAGRAEFRGFVPKKKLGRLYSECSIFASPSLREPFGISLLDAMAAGKPCVATRNTGLLEFLPKGVCIVTKEKNPAELAKAISFLLENKKKRGELGRKARYASKNLSWEKIALKTKKAYAQIMKSAE